MAASMRVAVRGSSLRLLECCSGCKRITKNVPQRSMSVINYWTEQWLNWTTFNLRRKNVLVEKRVEYWGSELAAAHWLLAHQNSAVQFTNGHWYAKNKKGRYYLPRDAVKDEYIISIDAKRSRITYDGLENLFLLKHLKYLSLKGCPHIDDFCLARLHHFKDSLTHLNISECPQITERGLASLHSLKKLERLNMKNLPQVDSPELISVMLEDVLPNLKLQVVSQHVARHHDMMDAAASWRKRTEDSLKQNTSRDEKNAKN
ncbi:distal membrane-arm assembly complex protein 2-like [Saccoglossus kowalevskii]